jgi:hypothetical protein
MTHYDIRVYDIEDPKTTPEIIKKMRTTVADAAEKAESFQVTHDPIDLKEKLVIKQRTLAAKAQAQAGNIEQSDSVVEDGHHESTKS